MLGGRQRRRRDAVGDGGVRDVSNTAASTSTISNQIELVNNGTSRRPAVRADVRYWFTEDGTGTLDYACDYAPVGCAT